MKKCGGAGYLHRLAKPIAATPTPKKTSSQPKDWPAIASELAKRFSSDHRRDVAEKLRLPTDVLDALPLIGLANETTEFATITFPECDAADMVIGINRRYPNGTKKAMSRGRWGG